MSPPALEIQGLQKRFGGVTASDDLTLTILEGEVHAVIGPNGAGKTTLVQQLAGEITPDAGEILYRGRAITGLPPHARSALGLARSHQVTSLFLDMSAADNTALSVQARDGHSFRFWADARKDRGLRDRARAALAQVGLEARADVLVAALSHGEQRRLEIAVALATEPSLLLLDEPMAGMGADELPRMLELLDGLRGRLTMVLIEHDMDVVFKLADRITVLVHGHAIATGPPAAIRADRQVRRAYLGDEVPGDA